MPKFLIITIGSHGDVHPFLGLALTLKSRGHEVSLVTSGYFRDLIERAGINFIELGTAERFREGLKMRDLWHPTRGTKIVFEWGVVPMIRPMYEIIAKNHVPGETVLVASSLALGARIAQDKLGIPTATVHLAPAVFRSLIDPPKLPALFMPRWMPNPIKKTLWWVGDRLIIDPIVAPEINSLRHELGLAPVRYVLRDWWNSPQMVIGMFPDWFATPPADWPKQTRLTSFPLWDESGHHALDPSLEAFLNAGDAPIAFTPGSAMIHGEQFFQSAVDACGKINRRALLVTRHAEQLPKSLPASVRHVPYAPFSELLPRCAALVHHGGIGTTAQTFNAGIPQLVMPMAHDQFDNAIRVKRLGAGDWIRESRFKVGNVAQLLQRMLNDASVATRTKQIASQMQQRNGLAETADLLETLAPIPAQ